MGVFRESDHCLRNSAGTAARIARVTRTTCVKGRRWAWTLRGRGVCIASFKTKEQTIKILWYINGCSKIKARDAEHRVTFESFYLSNLRQLISKQTKLSTTRATSLEHFRGFLEHWLRYVSATLWLEHSDMSARRQTRARAHIHTPSCTRILETKRDWQLLMCAVPSLQLVQRHAVCSCGNFKSQLCSGPSRAVDRVWGGGGAKREPKEAQE